MYGPIFVHAQVENVEIESPNAEESEEFWPLSGKPYFDVILTKTHIKSPHLVVSTLLPLLIQNFMF